LSSNWIQLKNGSCGSQLAPEARLSLNLHLPLSPMPLPPIFPLSHFSHPLLTSETLRGQQRTMVLVLFSLGFVELARGTATCYFPSGKISDGMPCNSSTTGQSACCNPGNLCMSSGLCFDKGLIARGSCTDATWTDDSCAKSCVDCKSHPPQQAGGR